MNLMYATDKNYAAICGTSMYSLLINNQAANEIHIYLIEDNIEDEKEKFIELVKKFNRTITIIAAQEIFAQFRDFDVPRYNGGYTTYIRLGVADYLQNIDKLLYIDCDTLILNNIQEMYDTDIQNAPLGAVSDGMNASCNLLIKRKKTDMYYNAGILLMNLRYWRTHKIFEKIQSDMKTLNLKRTATASDQDIINYSLGDMIIKLPLKYNVLVQNRVFKPESFRYMIEKDDITYYSLSEMRDASENPCILHFAGFSLERPWYSNSLDPVCPMWDSYLRKTPWKSYEKQKISQTRWRKTCIFVLKNFPEWIYMIIKKYEERFKYFKKKIF